MENAFTILGGFVGIIFLVAFIHGLRTGNWRAWEEALKIFRLGFPKSK